MDWTSWIPAFQFWFGEPEEPGKLSIAFGSVYLYCPLAVRCGNATARVCTTTPCDAARSFFAFRIVALLLSAWFRHCSSDSGCEIHAGELVSAFCAEIFRFAAKQINASVKIILVFFMG